MMMTMIFDYVDDDNDNENDDDNDGDIMTRMIKRQEWCGGCDPKSVCARTASGLTQVLPRN